jgi:TonB family protein
MNSAPSLPLPSAVPLRTELASLAASVGFTLALFAGIAQLENVHPAGAAAMDIADIKMAALPLDAPPPKPADDAEPVEAAAVPLAGLDAGSADSPIKIAVLPPELAGIIPVPEIPPSAVIRSGRPAVDFKPRAVIDAEYGRVYQRSEVDRPPAVLSRDDPVIPDRVRNDAAMMRVTLLIVIDPRGGITSVRIFKSSGNAQFDRIIMESVQASWVFSPAMKNGRNVRCMVEQLVTVKWTGGSPFEL